jgi:hypothetical protein
MQSFSLEVAHTVSTPLRTGQTVAIQPFKDANCPTGVGQSFAGAALLRESSRQHDAELTDEVLSAHCFRERQGFAG